MQVPLHHLGAIYCFGDVTTSTALLHKCAEEGCPVVLLDRSGRFKARIEGPLRGNVLLRQAQHLASADAGMTAAVARNIVAAKIQNSRQTLLRGARDSAEVESASRLRGAAETLAQLLPRLEVSQGLDVMRGIEGAAARVYKEWASTLRWASCMRCGLVAQPWASISSRNFERS